MHVCCVVVRTDVFAFFDMRDIDGWAIYNLYSMAEYSYMHLVSDAKDSVQ